MATSKYLPIPVKLAGEERPSPLPRYSSDKLQRRTHTSLWFVPMSIAIPGIHSRRLRLLVPNTTQLHIWSRARFGMKRPAYTIILLLALGLSVFALSKRFLTRSKQWPGSGPPSTLVFKESELRRIWMWEIDSGHYPSKRKSMHSLYTRVTVLT